MYAKARDYLGLEETQSVSRTPIYAEKFVRIENFSPPTKAETTPKPVEEEIVVSKGQTSDPKVWGPPFWFSLHVSAAHYPENPSQIVRERMKNRILAIPYEVPCSTCRPHASAFVESHREHLDKIVSNRHELGKFYVDFHNKVNKRYGKPEWTYEKAYKYYSGRN